MPCTVWSEGRFQDIDGDVERFAVGVEESHGILITPAVRDKDAAGGALIWPRSPPLLLRMAAPWSMS